MLSQANDQSSAVLSLRKTSFRVTTKENSFIQLFTTNLSRIINCEISNLLSSFRAAFIIIKTYFCVAFTTGPTGKRKSSLLSEQKFKSNPLYLQRIANTSPNGSSINQKLADGGNKRKILSFARGVSTRLSPSVNRPLSAISTVYSKG